MGSYTLTIYEDIYFPKNIKAPVGKIVVFFESLSQLVKHWCFGIGGRVHLQSENVSVGKIVDFPISISAFPIRQI